MQSLQLPRIPYLRYDWFNYDSFQRGKEVARGEHTRCDYWHGSNAIRETSNYYYLLVTGSTFHSGSSIFIHRVYKVEKGALNGVDLTLLVNELDSLQAEDGDPDEKAGFLIEDRND